MKKLTIKVIEKDDGEVSVSREVEGFGGFEILGLLEEMQQDIIDQIMRKPNNYERVRIKDGEKIETREKGADYERD